MTTYRSLNHTKWHCQYHVVFIPKYRRKAMYGGLRQELGEVFRRLAAHRESEVEEGHLLPDHVHMMMSIPPKYSVAQVIARGVGTGGDSGLPAPFDEREAADAGDPGHRGLGSALPFSGHAAQDVVDRGRHSCTEETADVTGRAQPGRSGAATR